MTLAWILLASLLGGLLSIAGAALLAFSARAAWVPWLVSYAVGALLGAVFLEMLPHAFEESGDPGRTSLLVLVGILGFFTLEKLVLWRHCHAETCEAHTPAAHDAPAARDVQAGRDIQAGRDAQAAQAVLYSGLAVAGSGAADPGSPDTLLSGAPLPNAAGRPHGHVHRHDAPARAAVPPPGHDFGRSGLMILIGDTFHNLVDGVLIAAAFVADFRLGVVTALAIVAHEIPQEVGDFLVLLHSGFGRRRALLFNLASSGATMVGGVAGYFALRDLQSWVPDLLAVAASSMIYVAVADLIPGLHKRPELRDTALQVGLILLGVGSIALARALVGHGVTPGG